MAQKIICRDIPPKIYFDGERFSTWHGKEERAQKIAMNIARRLALRIMWQHQEKHCGLGVCDEQYVGCKCHPGEFVPHNYVCTTTANYSVFLIKYRGYKTMIGRGGDYGVGIKVICSCTCVVPMANTGPFDFLGLVNSVAGILKGEEWPEVVEEIADLVEWMKENLGQEKNDEDH